MFAFDKFRSYLVATKVIVFSDHEALKFLLKKTVAKPRLIRWMLLLQEFDNEIKDRSRAQYCVANHLSCITHHPSDPSSIEDDFPNEQLLQCKVSFLGILIWLIIWLLVFYLQIPLGPKF